MQWSSSSSSSSKMQMKTQMQTGISCASRDVHQVQVSHNNIPQAKGDFRSVLFCSVLNEETDCHLYSALHPNRCMIRRNDCDTVPHSDNAVVMQHTKSVPIHIRTSIPVTFRTFLNNAGTTTTTHDVHRIESNRIESVCETPNESTPQLFCRNTTSPSCSTAAHPTHTHIYPLPSA